MITRLTRAERSALNRERVLEAAGELFRSKGFHGASLDEIADTAGFSKGVIYSQFGGKDDLFLALLMKRMEWRRSQALELVRNGPAGSVIDALVDNSREVQDEDVAWALLVLEFRIHAARTPGLDRRFAELHRRTLELLAEIFEELATRTGIELAHTAPDLARFALALESGSVLERLVEGPGAASEVAGPTLSRILTRSGEGRRREGS